MDPMDILSDYHQAMITALRRVFTEHHKSAADDIRRLIKEYPLLRSATLAEAFGFRPDDDNRTGAWALQFAQTLGRQRTQHTYSSVHDLVDRYYLRAVMREHRSILRAAAHLQITRARLRARLQLLGLDDEDYKA